MWRARSALIASALMPPVLSSPSLSSTTAPIGRSDVSSLNCLRLSPMRVEGAVGCSSFRLSMRAGAVVDAIKARLKGSVEAGQHAVLKRLHGLRLARGTVLGDAHAARIVHQHGNDVLLRLQLGDTVIAGCHSSTRTIAASSVCNPQMTQARQLRMIGAASLRRRPDQPGQSRGRGYDQQHQHPLRPCSQQRESGRAQYAERGYLKRNSNIRAARAFFETRPCAGYSLTSRPNGSSRR